MSWPAQVNYRGDKIPTAAGLAFLIAPVLIILLRSCGAAAAIGPARVLSGLPETLISAPYNERVIISLVFLVIALCLLGLLDDLVGGRQARGFKGHLSELLKGRITTGLIKAAGGGLASLAVAWYLALGSIGWEILLNAVLIALAVNTFNLLDLRPGRALKIFFVVLILFWLASIGGWLWASPALWVFIITAAALFPFDLRSKIMLGDAGSNVLGGIVGLSAVVVLGTIPKVIVFIVFLALNAISEKWSFTQIIEDTQALRWFDNLGRSN